MITAPSRFLLPLVLLAAALPASAQTSKTIVVDGTALVDSLPQLGFTVPGANPSCGTAFNCFAVLTWCTPQASCNPGDSGAMVAAALAAAVNSGAGCGPNPGFSAVANGNRLTISFASDFDCCLASGEIVGCVGGTDSLPLGDCTINNLCNNVACDETLPHVSGLRMSPFVPSAPAVPTLGEWGLASLSGLLLAAGLLAVRRRARAC